MKFAGSDEASIVGQPDEEPWNGPDEPRIENAEVTRSIIDQLDEESWNRPVEPVIGDSVVAPVEVVVEQYDETVDVTPARGSEVRNSFGNLIGWLDPGAKPIVLAPETHGIRLRRLERHQRSRTRIVLLLSEGKASESPPPPCRGQQTR